MAMHGFRALTLTSVLLTLLATAPARGSTFNFVAPLGLTGDQEVPARPSPATGTGRATYDDATHLLDVHLTWTGLLSTPGAAHIHCCPGPGVNGPVAVDFVPAGFPDTTSGAFDHTFDLDLASSYGTGFLSSFGGDVDAARDAVVAGLIAGLTYFNIHTAPPLGFQGGEIRGDIVLVSSPATLVLLALGAAAVIARRRLV